MTDLMQSVLSALGQDQVDAMARRIGVSPQQTENAIQAALPLLIGQMARNSAQPQGAQALHRALERDHANVDLGGLLGAVLGGGGSRQGGGGLGDVLGAVLGGGQAAPARSGDALGDGMAILGHIFGQRQSRVASSVGQVGGMDGQQSSQLLAMLAPLVMAALSRMMQSRGGGDAGALGGLLGGQAQQMQSQSGAGGLLGAVLDRDGDGDVDLSDLMRNGQLLGGLLGRR
ncbi:MAG: DUF937 domain-containing protein [Chiayiivirga sp.]|uniref:DUF937 domain-containing protein n=1 Tax=Chiayiivirga sp. TaxID=2041042 RepID=UPI0025BBD0AD|nr:DUF937 domain-containing protein [Chiayiivirga sp.]MCI1710802.1 DUF937 domain-containing protein [Chiayiivirga sp.]MCI1728357.1 DUF937 domain-containing protein [Chiayiivirga sp.]